MAPEKLEKMFKNIAETEGFTNYEIHPHVDPLKGDGFLSECYTGEVIDKSTGTKIEAYIKVQPQYMKEISSPSYDNEHNFYSKIFPELNKFQIEKGVKEPFQNVPRFYCGDDQEDNKYVAMENLRIQNYAMVDKSVSMDKENMKLVFKIYGKFHALSFAYKDQNYERYSELTKPLNNLLGDAFKSMLVSILPKAYDAVKHINTYYAKKIEPIVENMENRFDDVAAYKGKYCAITHGDCWSNNMLFKYGENGQIKDIKLLDFQFCRESTPIHDLSYFFYSAASKEEFPNVEAYLELYHKSFSAFATELGSDPEKLLPLDVLKSEWKKYGLFGIFLGVMLWQAKLLKKEKIEEFAKASGENPVDESKKAEIYNKLIGDLFETDAFRKNTSDILIHAIEYGII